jgi:hypothetical protein
LRCADVQIRHVVRPRDAGERAAWYTTDALRASRCRLIDLAIDPVGEHEFVRFRAYEDRIRLMDGKDAVDLGHRSQCVEQFHYRSGCIRVDQIIDARGMGGRFNDPPRDKLPAEARCMREWSPSQIKHATSNDNPFEADELVCTPAARQKKGNVLGSLSLIVISRGLLDEEGPQAVERENPHRKDQAALTTLSSAGKLIVAAKSGHHVPLDEPDLVGSAIREIIQTVRR